MEPICNFFSLSAVSTFLLKNYCRHTCSSAFALFMPTPDKTREMQKLETVMFFLVFVFFFRSSFESRKIFKRKILSSSDESFCFVYMCCVSVQTRRRTTPPKAAIGMRDILININARLDIKTIQYSAACDGLMGHVE